jgi:flagellar hook-length control protein FliK
MEIKDNKISTKLTTNSTLSTEQKNTSKDIGNTLLNKAIQHKNINLTDILKNIFNEIITKQKTNKALLETIKNLPAFKSFQNFSSEIKELIKQLEVELPKSKQIEQLKSMLTDIKQIDAKVLKKGVLKSGVLLESYLKNFIQTSNKNLQNEIKVQLFDDIKTILTTIETSEQTTELVKNQANKMVTQIEYYQLLSYLNHSNFTYLPFDWNELEDGDIEFKSEKDEHTCHINLTLKHYGNLKINIIYTDGNFLSLGFFPEQNDLKEKIQENLPILRKMMNNIQMNLLNVSIIENQEKKQDPNIAKFGAFNDDSNYRIDIRV